jgi:hypothetical protein
VIRELREDPQGERAQKVMLLTLVPVKYSELPAIV